MFQTVRLATFYAVEVNMVEVVVFFTSAQTVFARSSPVVEFVQQLFFLEEA